MTREKPRQKLVFFIYIKVMNNPRSAMSHGQGIYIQRKKQEKKTIKQTDNHTIFGLGARSLRQSFF